MAAAGAEVLWTEAERNFWVEVGNLWPGIAAVSRDGSLAFPDGPGQPSQIQNAQRRIFKPQQNLGRREIRSTGKNV